MITFQKLSAKHYRVDEFNYTDVFKLSNSADFFEKPVMFTEKNNPSLQALSWILPPVGQQILIRL